MELHSLPSPFDPIHHGGRRLDTRDQADSQYQAAQSQSQNQGQSQGSADSMNKESVPTVSALWQTSGSGSAPSLPGTPRGTRRQGSMSFAIENGSGMDPDIKSNGIPSPSGSSRTPFDGSSSADGVASKITNRHQSYSWAGINPVAMLPMPLQLPSSIANGGNFAGSSGTPSSRTHSYANIPQHPASATNSATSGSSAHLQRDASGSNTLPQSSSSSSLAASGSGANVSVASVPSVEEVARSVIQQLVLGSPRSQALGLLGLVSQGAQLPVSAAPMPPAHLQATTTGMPITSASSSAPFSSGSAPELQADGAATSQTTTNTVSPASVGTAPLAQLTNVAPFGSTSAAAAADGSVFPVAAEMSQSAVPSNSGTEVFIQNPSLPPSLALDKRSEHLLDQHLLSSQKVASYRISDEISLPADSSSSSLYLSRLFGLHGQVAIVTGAARGIGLALARGLAMAGARVCMADMNFEQVARESAALNDELKQADATFPLGVDVTKRESIVNLFTSTVERYGMLSICVNNAGLAISGEDPKRNYSESFSEEDFDLTINLNLKAVFFCCQFAARWMIANSVQGSIINIASMSAKVVNWPQRQSVYNASKAAVVQLTKCLAVEWCSYGIRVNSISPGYIDTPLNRQISIAHLRHEWQKKTPQHRLGDPKDLVAAVIYLASNRAAAFTTGENIVIDGGYTLW